MKDFRTFTHAIPLKDKTTVLFNDEGFANTIEDKIAMAKDALGDLYIAWPGDYETHVFEATAAEILEVLDPPAIGVGALVRMTRGYGSARPGMVGVVRVVDGETIGIEFGKTFPGHNLRGAIAGSGGYWVPTTYAEVA